MMETVKKWVIPFPLIMHKPDQILIINTTIFMEQVKIDFQQVHLWLWSDWYRIIVANADIDIREQEMPISHKSANIL